MHERSVYRDVAGPGARVDWVISERDCVQRGPVAVEPGGGADRISDGDADGVRPVRGRDGLGVADVQLVVVRDLGRDELGRAAVLEGLADLLGPLDPAAAGVPDQGGVDHDDSGRVRRGDKLADRDSVRLRSVPLNQGRHTVVGSVRHICAVVRRMRGRDGLAVIDGRIEAVRDARREDARRLAVGQVLDQLALPESVVCRVD